jgi:choline dehydrogenase-like flavoprotein
MEHPTFEGGNVILTGRDHFKLDETSEAFFSPTAGAMQRLGILNFGIRLVETPYPGVKRLVADLACTAPRLAEWTAAKLDQNLRCAAQLHIAWEQAPDAENRVALSASERDQAGVPRIDLHWKKSALDHRTLLEGLRLFGKAMADADFGRVRIDDWILKGSPYPDNQELAGYHHMGGTRMGEDPQKSVVDADCRVHGMDNLFVGGSSVFATSGEANPTTTITALSLRLARHLEDVVAARA